MRGKVRFFALWLLWAAATQPWLNPRGVDTGLAERAKSAAPGSVTFAVIGDYGVCGARTGLSFTCTAEKAVAAIVHSWHPTAVFTTGDNSYNSGSALEIPGDQEPYKDYIASGKFFPSFGNHDWDTDSLQPSLRYFRLSSPYYKKVFPGLLTAYLLDTNPQEPAGSSAKSAQARWLKAQLASSSTPWNVTFNHQPPYSSCGHGSNPANRWLAAPGVDVVFSGHDHSYERLEEPNASSSATITYVVVGTSGGPLQFGCSNALSGQQKAIYGKFGAVKLEVTPSTLVASFCDLAGVVGDSFTLRKPAGRASESASSESPVTAK